MAEPGPKKQFALDTNILIDLGNKNHFAGEFIGFFRENGFRIYVPPTVVVELGLLTEVRGKEQLARDALLAIPRHGMLPFEMRPVEDDITDNFYRILTNRGLLPYEEKRDGEILAETSLHGISILITRDAHLLNIEETSLALAFNEADLNYVKVIHPREMIKAAQRIFGK
jgi:hypothetical protein